MLSLGQVGFLFSLAVPFRNGNYLKRIEKKYVDTSVCFRVKLVNDDG